MKYVLSAIIGALAFLVALLFGKRRLLDNGIGASRIGNAIGSIGTGLEDIASTVGFAESRVENITGSVNSATDKIARARDILEKVRQRTDKDKNNTESGTGGD
jgi:hypothetical protein